MSSILRIPASSFMFSPGGASASVLADGYDDSVEKEALLRAELQKQYDQRLAEGIDKKTCDIEKRYKILLENSTSQFSRLIVSLRREIQDKVVDLAVELAEVIVRHQLPDPEMMQELISKTLDPVSDLQGARVRVCPEDFELMGDQMINDLNGIEHAVEFVSDSKLGRGDVIVESRNGIFDARLDERLNLLKETLDERSGRKSESDTEV